MTTQEALVILAWDALQGDVSYLQQQAVDFARNIITIEAENAMDAFIKQYGPEWAKD